MSRLLNPERSLVDEFNVCAKLMPEARFGANWEGIQTAAAAAAWKVSEARQAKLEME